jgi:hypothetical protein
MAEPLGVHGIWYSIFHAPCNKIIMYLPLYFPSSPPCPLLQLVWKNVFVHRRGGPQVTRVIRL